jgi:alpha-1,3-rhamnosyl/mannosyltransferase
MGAQLMSPLRMRRNGADLLHGPANALPLVHPGLPGVVTIHDLAIYDHPEWFPGGQWFATRIVVPRSIRGADAVICPSVATRSSIERIFGVGAERCHVIPHGVEPDFARPVTEAVRVAVRSRYGLPDRYLLQVGTIQPRKNYVTTLRALARIPQDMRLPLVAVGSAGWGDSSVAQTVAQLGLERWVRFVGYAGLPDLPALYQMAEAAVFPSLDEGFGLPVLEALAAGTPLAASNAGALPEVAGEAALLSDPLDDVALAANLRRLVEDASTRARLVAAGRARAKEFTWSRSAAAHLAVYRSVAG